MKNRCACFYCKCCAASTPIKIKGKILIYIYIYIYIQLYSLFSVNVDLNAYKVSDIYILLSNQSLLAVFDQQRASFIFLFVS